MKRFLAAILSVLLIMTSVPSTFASVDEEQKGNFESFYLKTIVEAMSKGYKFGITKGEIYDAVVDYVLTEHPELLEGMLEAAASTMDEHTYYMPAEVLEGFYEQIDSSYVGIGVTVERVKDAVMISEVRRGAPADSAGILAGDLIIKVNGEDVTDCDIQTVSGKVRGPEDTTVDITVRRGDEEITFVVTRKTVTVESVVHEIDIEKQVGYIYISGFNADTARGVSDALKSFDYQDIENVIVDVRNNPGGELNAAIDTLSMFVPKGKLLVTIVDAFGRETKLYSKSKLNRVKYNVLVLTNENSASAAELFAGAIRDNKAGKVMGTKTFGKGTVQSMMGLRDVGDLNLGDIKVTTAEYFLPGGAGVNKKGVSPDIVVKNKEVLVNDGSFKPFLFDSKYSLGDTGEGVLAIKQRLDALGIFVGEVNDIYDEETAVAVNTFQKISGLYPYGVMDITTQNYLENTFNEAKKVIDLQTEEAYKFFTKVK